MFRVVTDPKQVSINLDKYVYVDTETIGLYGRIRLVQIYQSDWDEVVIFDTNITSIVEIYNLLSQATCVFHNGCYDMACFIKNIGKDAIFNNWEDTFLAGRLCFPELESFSLDAMLERTLNFDPYLEYGLDKKTMQKSNFKGELSNEQLLYGAIDVKFMPNLMQKIYESNALENFSYTLDKLAVQYMLKFSQVGIPVCKTNLHTEREVTQSIIDEFSKNYSVNPNSPKQVKEWLGTDSSDDYTLAYLIAKGVDEAKVIREWRKATNKLKFICKFDTETSRVFGNFNVVTKSGRSNCNEENLQQIPSSLKHLFKTDKFFVYADFSNLELRTFCAMVGERVMERMFREDIDLHTYSAHRLFNVPMEEVSKQQRQIAKTFNFSSLYGAGVDTRLKILLKNTGILLSEDEGQRLANEWLRAYPSVKGWQQDNVRKWKGGVKGYTALGRPYIAKLYTQFGSIQIQGSGAEVAKLAMHYMLKELDVYKLCVFIHDSYTFECDTLDEAKHYAKVLAESMQDAWFEVSKNFVIKDLPMPVLAGVGKNWRKLQSDEDLIYQYELKGLEFYKGL